MICDPLLGALFTPPRPELGRYEVCTTSAGLESAAAEAGTGGQRGPDRGAGGARCVRRRRSIQSSGPRAALRRHAGPGRAAMAAARQPVQSETLLSPYPDATLTRLNSGTMVIRFTLDRGPREPADTGFRIAVAVTTGAYNPSIR